MSRINRIRIVNLNYNGNSIRVDDEIFDLNGETTFLSLRNGGGKSVLVQMITSLFVHKNYRNFNERLFQNYFTTNRPTFILTEWVLDQKQGYVLVGMMVRKNQSLEENEEPLEMINFVGTYKENCEYDIENLPIMEAAEGKKILFGYGKCKQQIEALHKKYASNFSCFDMNHAHQQKQYFKVLRQYQIDYKEWESIICKINKKESGLSELFMDARDERGLIEKWFLNTIEKKLDQDSNRIRVFQELTQKFIQQYKENETKINRKKIIDTYFEDIKVVNEGVLEYDTADRKYEDKKREIACFIQELDKNIKDTGKALEQEKHYRETLLAEIERIEHERISYAIYELEDQKNEKVMERVDSEIQVTKSKEYLDSLESDYAKYSFAVNYEEQRDFKQEIEEIEAQLSKELGQMEENQEEIAEIGQKLYLYYEAEKEDNIQKKEKVERQLEGKKKLEETLKSDRDGYNEQLLDLYKEQGKLEESFLQFENLEKEFVSQYSVELWRNMDGFYEEGTLQIMKTQFEDECMKVKKKITNCAEKISKNKQEETLLLEKDQDVSLELAKGNVQLEEMEVNRNKRKEEVERRRIIMKYFDFPEEKIDDKNLLLGEIQKSISVTVKDQDSVKYEYRNLKNEMERLSSGKLVDIPEQIFAILDEKGISYVTGLDWLKRNKRSKEDNQALIKKNPLLPFSLIISKTQMKLLESLPEFYLDYPVFFMEKEKMESVYGEKENGIVVFDGVACLCLFNHRLLETKQLEQLLERKKTECKSLEQKLQRLESERQTYDLYYKEISEQEYSLSVMETLEKNIEQMKQNIVRLEEMQVANREEKQKLLKQRECLETEIKQTQSKLDVFYEPRVLILQKLMDAYENYKVQKERLRICEKQIGEAEKQMCGISSQLERINEEEKIAQRTMLQLENEMKNLEKEAEMYQAFAGSTKPTNLEKIEYDVRIHLQARYKALTSGVKANVDELQKRLTKAKGRLLNKQEELKGFIQFFTEEQCKGIVVNQEMILQIKRKIEDSKHLYQNAFEREKAIEREIETLKGKISNLEEVLKQQLHTTDKISRSEILNLDFSMRDKQAKYNVEQKETNIKTHETRLQLLQANRTAMEEYSDFVGEGILFHISEKNNEEITKLQGILKREINAEERNRKTKQEKVYKMILNLSNKECYRDDFFSKGFDNCLSLVENVTELKQQLQVIEEVYQGIIKQLLVDLQMIEKEKSNLLQTFMDYIQSVNEQMEKIDKNSNITIRGKNVKMLKIITPEWELHKDTYDLRLNDFMEHLIKRGMDAIGKGENLEEMIAKNITCKKLYDDIVGISNIEIQLYKIEANREVKISWKDVASNSGGEGFLSAFVVLACLLSYIRRNETDIFSQENEGKVLIMDNPFAQTSSKHLLKPLIEMANKSNTQLICLSGLGGDDIYNRFDNIYVLTVEDSKVRRGMQYLKAEHKKGEEIQKLVSAQFKTEMSDLLDWEEI